MWDMIGFSFYAFEGIGCVMPIMEQTRDKNQFPKLLTAALMTLASLFIFFGLICYASFMSSGNKSEDTIIIYNIVPDNEKSLRKTIIVITELLYCVNLVFSYPLTVYPANKIIESFIFHKFFGMKEVTLKRKWLKNLSRLVVVFLGCFLSITFEKVLDNFLGVAGAVLGISIILIVPTLFHYKVCATTPLEKKMDIGFMLFSFAVLCLCTYKGVEAWINEESESPDL